MNLLFFVLYLLEVKKEVATYSRMCGVCYTFPHRGCSALIRVTHMFVCFDLVSMLF